MGKRLGTGARKPAAPKMTAPKRTGPAPAGDNSLHGEEAERVQLISIVAQLSAADDGIEAAKVPLKAAQAKRKTVIGLGKAAGFPAKVLERRLEEMKMGTREMAVIEAAERKQRRWLGIIDADQASLILGDQAPQEAKDEAHFRGEGLKAGLRNLAAVPPPGIPERFVQAWLQERERGVALAAPSFPDAVDGRVKPVGEQAADDFAADNPEVDIDAAAKALKKSSFMDRSQGEDPADPGPEDPPVAGLDPALVDEGFEATPEELAAQSTRRTLEDAREGRTSGEDVEQGDEVV